MQSEQPQVPGYVVGAELGRGSTAVVYAGVRADGTPVALKVLTAGSSEWMAEGSSDGVVDGLGDGPGQRLLDEAGLGARLRVEGLVACHGVARTGDGRAVVVTDLVSGGSLAEVVAARARLVAGEVVTVVSPVARTLADLHARGVVHGDVSPGNVLFDPRGRPLVADLGVARLTGEAGAADFGTPGFVAPEVLAGAAPTPASDVYAVGALAWLCLVGEPPRGLGLRGDLRELAPQAPAAMREAVLACLSHEPDRRPGAHEAALALFDSAVAEPLLVRTEPDETALITRRLRASVLAADDPDESLEAAAARARRRWVPEVVTSRLRAAGVRAAGAPVAGARAARARAARARVRRPGRGGHRRPRVSGRPALVGVLPALALVLAGVVLLGQGGVPQRLVSAVSGSVGGGGGAAGARADETADESAEDNRAEDVAAGGSSAPVAPASGSPVVPVAPVAGRTPGVAATPAQLQADPRAVVQALSTARALALGAGHESGLAGVDHPGSEAWAADARVLSDMAARGLDYDRVAFTVRSASVVTVTDDRAVVRTEVDTPAYDLVAGDGGRTGVPAETGEPVLLNLRRGEAGWRVEAVAAT